MRNKIFKLLLVFGLLQYLPMLHAQVDAFESEVKVQNGITYYNGKPFTGTLYSDDEQEINNECKCTLKAGYRDGKLHGEKKMWYASGKLKYKGVYEKGKPVGKHIELFESGAPKYEWEYASDGSYTQTGYDSEGNKTSETYFDASTGEKVTKIYKNGSLVSEEKYVHNKLESIITYEDNKPVKEKFFDNKHDIKKIYDKNGIPVARESYLKGTQTKDGVWEVYDESGNLAIKATYSNGKLIAKQSYKNGKKHGVGFAINVSSGNMTKYYYRNGELKRNYTIEAKYKVENYLKTLNSGYEKIVVKYHDDYYDEDKYFLITYPNTYGKSETVRRSVEKVVAKLLRRPQRVEPDEYTGEYLSGIIELSSLKTEYEKKKYKWNRKVDDKLVEYEEWGYVFHIEYTINVFDTKSHFSRPFEYDAKTRQYNYKKMLLKGLLYPKDLDEAFEMAFQNIGTYNTNAYAFPAIAIITRVSKDSKKAVRRVMLDKGYESFVLRKAIFYYIDEDANEEIPRLKIIANDANRAEARVTKNGDKLKAYMETHPKVYVIEKLY